MTTTAHAVKQQIAALVSAASVSSTDPRWDSSNLPVLQLIADFAAQQGFQCEIQALGGPVAKANLIARLGPDTAGGLVLSGHTDTVPFDEGRWRSDPLTLTERDGALYGLGATDMKGFFAIALAAVNRIDHRQLKRPIYLLGTADEESTMAGARALSQSDIARADAAIIGEPTALQPVRLHKGIMMQAIDIHGTSGHSSNPALGENAIDALPLLLAALDQYRQALRSRFHCELLSVPHPTLNFGCVHGGDSPNRICGHLSLHIDVRMVPGMHFEQVEAELQSAIASIGEQVGLRVTMRRLIDPVPAFEQDANSALVQAACAESGMEAISVNYGTEAPFLQQLGLDTIVMGPGHIDCAHQPDEHLPLAQIQPAIDRFSRLIAHYCL
jgi:acetylornithine deacetylase